jgi:hypothetical protein
MAFRAGAQTGALAMALLYKNPFEARASNEGV